MRLFLQVKQNGYLNENLLAFGLTADIGKLRYSLYMQLHRQILIEAENLRYVGLISQRRGMIPGCHTL